MAGGVIHQLLRRKLHSQTTVSFLPSPRPSSHALSTQQFDFRLLQLQLIDPISVSNKIHKSTFMWIPYSVLYASSASLFIYLWGNLNIVPYYRGFPPYQPVSVYFCLHGSITILSFFFFFLISITILSYLGSICFSGLKPHFSKVQILKSHFFLGTNFSNTPFSKSWKISCSKRTLKQQSSMFSDCLIFSRIMVSFLSQG